MRVKVVLPSMVQIFVFCILCCYYYLCSKLFILLHTHFHTRTRTLYIYVYMHIYISPFPFSSSLSLLSCV